MVFSSFQFLLGVLPLSLLIYHLCRVRGWQMAAKLCMVAISLVFYAWAGLRFVPLVLGSIVVNYTFGWWIARWKMPAGGGSRSGAKPVFVAGILFNLGLLCWFKYADFFLSNAFYLMGFGYQLHTVVLPLAISFFTFQQIAYLSETYKGDAPAGSFLDYVLFVLFFPHLVAGPITHHTEMLPQFARAGQGSFNTRFVTMGSAMLILGIAKKTLLADNLAKIADPVFHAAFAGHALGPEAAWRGALAYSFQLYFDFSGYSDMAIALGLLFGIRFPVNFASPYKSRSIIEFWRRWHISLSRFLRNYLYIPLGGNRRGPVLRYVNLTITMALGGLWHGAGWTFLIWGLLHGSYLVVNHAWRALAKNAPRLPGSGAVAWVVTFVAVVVGWVFFRANSLPAALTVLHAMLGLGTGAPPETGLALDWLLLAASGLIAFLLPNVLEWCDYPAGLPGIPDSGVSDIRRLRWRIPPAAAALALGVAAAFCIASLPNPGVFLYFNF